LRGRTGSRVAGNQQTELFNRHAPTMSCRISVLCLWDSKTFSISALKAAALGAFSKLNVTENGHRKGVVRKTIWPTRNPRFSCSRFVACFPWSCRVHYKYFLYQPQKCSKNIPCTWLTLPICINVMKKHTYIIFEKKIIQKPQMCGCPMRVKHFWV